MMRRSIVFATSELHPIVALARAAEAAGLDRVWTTEYLHRDSLVRALAIAESTQRIGVATGIAYAFTRLPMAMAAAAADIQRLSEDRFALGLSSGTRGVRRWYGADFEPPAPRIAAYVEAVRESWRENPDLESPPPIYAAALNPIMTRVVARTCDGVLLHALALGRTHLHERILPALRVGSEDREAPPHVAMWCITSVDRDEERARAMARHQLAFYLSTPSYASVAAGTSWEHVASDVRDAFAASDRKARWSDLAPLIPDATVDELSICGTPEQVRERASAREDELGAVGIDELVFQTVGADVSAEEVVANCQQIIGVLGPRSAP